MCLCVILSFVSFLIWALALILIDELTSFRVFPENEVFRIRIFACFENYNFM